MTAKQSDSEYQYHARKPEHPGALLERCYLQPLRISQSDLARLLRISRRRVNEIINGQRAISVDSALRLAHFFNTTPMFWLEKQQLWDLYELSRQEKVARREQRRDSLNAS